MAQGRGKQQQDVTTSIFDFIFDIQKSGRNKPFPKQVDGLSDYASALIEIGTQPTIYPLEQAFGQMNTAIGIATEQSIGYGVDAGLGQGAFTNPVAFSKKEIAKNRANASWASVGGFLHREIDSALVSMYARQNGASGETAKKVGSLYNQLIEKEMRDRGIFGNQKGYKYPTQRVLAQQLGSELTNDELKEETKSRPVDSLAYRTKEDINAQKDRFFNQAIDLRTEVIAKHHPQVSKRDLKTIIGTLQSERDKNERIKSTVATLQSTGLDVKDRLKISYMLWGDVKDKDDQGVYRIKEKALDDKMENIRIRYGLNESTAKQLKTRVKLYKEENYDSEVRKKELYKSLKNDYRLPKQDAFKLATELSSIEINDGDDIARDSLYLSLATDITENLKMQGNYTQIAGVRDTVRDILRPRTKATPGMRVERALMVTRWLSESNKWGGLLLGGVWQKIGQGDANITTIVEKRNVIDPDTKKIVGVYFDGTDSPMGKTLGKYYYLHPNNLMRGLFFSGELWLKWATDKNGFVDKKSFAYLMSQMAIGNQVAVLAKPMTGLMKKVSGTVNPMIQNLQRFAKNILTKALGATGVGGLVVDLFMSTISDRLAFIANQIVIAVVLAVVGILFVIFGAVGSIFYSDEYEEAMLNQNTQQTESVIGEETFTNEDFEIP